MLGQWLALLFSSDLHPGFRFRPQRNSCCLPVLTFGILREELTLRKVKAVEAGRYCTSLLVGKGYGSVPRYHLFIGSRCTLS